MPTTRPGPTLAYCSQQAMREAFPAPIRPKPMPMHITDASAADLLDWLAEKMGPGLLREATTDISAYLMARSLGDDDAARAALRAARIKRDLVEGVL
jgi:hypothetical protein